MANNEIRFMAETVPTNTTTAPTPKGDVPQYVKEGFKTAPESAVDPSLPVVAPAAEIIAPTSILRPPTMIRPLDRGNRWGGGNGQANPGGPGNGGPTPPDNGGPGNGGPNNPDNPGGPESEAGERPPSWWPPELGPKAWEALDSEPAERWIIGAAVAVNFLNEHWKFTDRRTNNANLQRLMDASDYFGSAVEQNRVYKRHASIINKVSEFREHEDQALSRVTDVDQRQQLRLEVYELEARQRRLNKLNQDGVAAGARPHGLYSQVGWERAIKEKGELEQSVRDFKQRVEGVLGADFLPQRAQKQEEVAKAQDTYEKTKKENDGKLSTETSELDWEKELKEPSKDQFPSYRSAERVIYQQEFLRLEKENPDAYKEEIEATRQKLISKEKERVERESKDEKWDPNWEPTREQIHAELSISGDYNENLYNQAVEAQEWYLNEAHESGLFKDVKDSLDGDVKRYVEIVSADPTQLPRVEMEIEEKLRTYPQLYESAKKWNYLRDLVGVRDDLALFRGTRGEYARRYLDNMYLVVNNLMVLEEQRSSEFSRTPGIDWPKLQENLTADSTWYELTDYGTIRFKGHRAIHYKLGAEQFARDLIRGATAFDPKETQDRMGSFLRVLGAVNAEELAQREGWSVDKALKFIQHLRHSTVNRATFHITNFLLDNIITGPATSFIKDFWAQEGMARMKDLIEENEWMWPLVSHLILNKYQTLLVPQGVKGQYINKEHIEWTLQTQLKEALTREAIGWEVKNGITGKRQQERLTELRNRNNNLSVDEKNELELLTKGEELAQLRSKSSKELSPKERKRLKELEEVEAEYNETIRDSLKQCKSEDEVKSKYWQKRVTLKLKDGEEEVALVEAVGVARKAYQDKVKELDDKRASDQEVNAEDLKQLKILRSQLTMVKKEYSKAHQNISSALDLTLKVFQAFGITAEKNAPMYVAENGDNVNINELTKTLKFSSIDAGRKEFKEIYGFEDNLALVRARSMEWNGRFAEGAAVLKTWEMIHGWVESFEHILGVHDEAKLLEIVRNITGQNKDAPSAAVQEQNKRYEGMLRAAGIDDTKLQADLVGFYIEIEEHIKATAPDKTLMSVMRDLIPAQARESFVGIKVIKKKEDLVRVKELSSKSDLTDTERAELDRLAPEIKFNLAKGYEWTGLTQEEFDEVVKTQEQIRTEGYGAVIRGKTIREILEMDDIDAQYDNLLALYEGARAQANSEEQIEAANRGEDTWLANTRKKLASTGRLGFVGLEQMQGTKQDIAKQFTLAVAESISFDENHSQLAYVLATTDGLADYIDDSKTDEFLNRESNFSPDRLSFGRYEGKSRNDYWVGLGLTSLGIEVGRFPTLFRRKPMHPKPLTERVGFKTITEVVGNSTGIDLVDNWHMITFAQQQDAMQTMQAAWKGGFDERGGYKMGYAAGDKLLDDGDKLRALEHSLLDPQVGLPSLEARIASIALGEWTLKLDLGVEEKTIDEAGEREARITKLLSPIAYYYQTAITADDAGLGMEFNDNFHNSAVIPTLLSRGRSGRLNEGGLRAYSSIAKMLLFLTFPKSYDLTESLSRHEYIKVRQGRVPVLLGDPVFVRPN